MPSVSIITKLAVAAGVLVQPVLGLPSSSFKPSSTIKPSFSIKPSAIPSTLPHLPSKVSISLKPTSTAVPTKENITAELLSGLACAAIGVEQTLYKLLNSDKDTRPEDILTAFAKEKPLPAELAYACLQSVPLNKTAATDWIKWIKPYVEFQSTLGWLKNPPLSYQQPAVDIMGGLDTIANFVTAGKFKGQYEFELAVWKLVQSAHDGHFSLSLPLLNLFIFKTPYRFVSISQDGIKMPEIFVSSDMDLISTGTRNTTTKPASAVKTINGKPAVEYMTQAAKDFVRSFIDPQADWNQLFSNSAAETSGSHSPFEAVSYYPGYTNFTLTFTNGTTVTEKWTAATMSDFTDVMNGQGVYDKFVAPLKHPEKDDEEEDEVTVPKKPSLKEWGAPYPAPAVVQEVLGAGGFITGYFLNRSSTAVLSLPSFHFEGEIAQLTAASTIAEFLAKCKARGMKRLVIDLQANGGGLIDAGFELFRQLFPTTIPFAGSQLRLPPSAELMGLTRGSANASIVVQNVSATYYYGTYLNFEGKGFPNWPSVINQQTQKGDKFTNTLRVNFTKTDQVLEAQGINTQRAPQYFAAKDILLLTDGRCSSTCAIFAEEMHQVGVKIVVAGGRPEPGPMQGVGGVKGSEVFTFADIDTNVEAIREINSSLPASCFPANGSSPFSGDAKSNVINLRNQIRKSQQDVPLHFVYQAAECRFFYTAKMLTDYSVLWQYAADALWSNQGLCAQGSTNHPSSGINVTTITGVGKNDVTNGTTSTTNVSFTGSGNSNGGLNAALLSGAMVCFALLLL